MKAFLSRLLLGSSRSPGRNRKIRGLSTAELVGIIVIVGILGALGGTYVNGLVTKANSNAGDQNANTLNTVAASVLAAGGTAGAGATFNIDTTSASTAIACLNAGVTVNNVLYQMTPPISAAALAAESGATSYVMNASANSVTFTYPRTAGDAP